MIIKKRKRRSKGKNPRKRRRENSTSLIDQKSDLQPLKKKSKRRVSKKHEILKDEPENEIHVNYEGSKETNGEDRMKNNATKLDKTRKKMQNVRLNSEIDFCTIGICQDYLKSGFCAFGDNCIYAHVREFKSSYEITKEWEEEQRKKEEEKKKKKEEIEEKNLIPEVCPICKKEYQNPVVTCCHHFFCEKCVIDVFSKKKNTLCYVCGTETNGSLNSGIEEIEKQKRKLKKKEQKKLENKED